MKKKREAKTTTTTGEQNKNKHFLAITNKTEVVFCQADTIAYLCICIQFNSFANGSEKKIHIEIEQKMSICHKLNLKRSL